MASNPEELIVSWRELADLMEKTIGKDHYLNPDDIERILTKAEIYRTCADDLEGMLR